MSKSYNQFLFECWLFESPEQDPSINRNILKDRLDYIVNSQKQHAKPISNSLMSIDLPSGHKVLYHKHGDSHSGVSIFDIKDKVAKHQVVHTLGGDTSEIHSNIQHMVDSGFEVRSHDKQSKGGRNLWMQIHNNVKHNEIGTVKGDVRTPMKNLSSKEDSNDPDELFYIK